MDIGKLIDENMRLKRDLDNYKNINLNEINEIVSLASEMASVLNECRNERINYSLAKKIDNILRKTEKFN